MIDDETRGPTASDGDAEKRAQAAAEASADDAPKPDAPPPQASPPAPRKRRSRGPTFHQQNIACTAFNGRAPVGTPVRVRVDDDGGPGILTTLAGRAIVSEHGPVVFVSGVMPAHVRVEMDGDVVGNAVALDRVEVSG